MAYIYKIENDINGKIYIGKTEQTIKTQAKAINSIVIHIANVYNKNINQLMAIIGNIFNSQIRRVSTMVVQCIYWFESNFNNVSRISELLS